MGLFGKKRLDPQVIIDIYTYNNNGKQDFTAKKFIQTLTEKQIKMLNDFSLAAHLNDKNEEDIAREMSEDYKKAVKEIRQQELGEKKNSEFTDVERIHTTEDYNNYLNNNRDKAMLSEDEEKRLIGMLDGFAKKKSEINARLDEMAKSGDISKGQAKMMKGITEILTKSASGLNK